jgi:predicted nuclease with TOPRIM domain
MPLSHEEINNRICQLRNSILELEKELRLYEELDARENHIARLRDKINELTGSKPVEINGEIEVPPQPWLEDKPPF